MDLAMNMNNDALLMAAVAGDIQVIQHFIESESVQLEATDIEGNTALILAARHNHFALVQLLIKAGANIHAVNAQGDTAFSLSIRQGEGHRDMVFCLLHALSQEKRAELKPKSLAGKIPFLDRLTRTDAVAFQYFLSLVFSCSVNSAIASSSLYQNLMRKNAPAFMLKFLTKTPDQLRSGRRVAMAMVVGQLAAYGYFRTQRAEELGFFAPIFQQVMSDSYQFLKLPIPKMMEMAELSKNDKNRLALMQDYERALSNFDLEMREVFKSLGVYAQKEEQHLPGLPTTVLGIIADYVRSDWYASNQVQASLSRAEKAAAEPVAVTFSARASSWMSSAVNQVRGQKRKVELVEELVEDAAAAESVAVTFSAAGAPKAKKPKQ